MTKTIITRSNLMSSPYNNVYDTINSRSNVPDPKNVNDLDRGFVYKNDPWSKGNYDGYPYIVVRFPQISKDNSNADGNVKDVAWEHEITVRTAMEGAINQTTGESTGVSNMEDIMDALNKVFDSKTVKDELRAYGMYNITLEVIRNDEILDGNDKHIFESELRLRYNARKKVGV